MEPIMDNLVIRRAKYLEAKKIKDFDLFIGDRRIDNWRGELLCGIINDEVVGFISYSSSQFYNRPYIVAICVKNEFRRRGIAFSLIKRVLEIYDGIDVWVSTEDYNKEAINLFKKSGFKEAGSLCYLNRDDSRELFFVKPGNL
jgi:ribosomal protein S18 acetylase RimI-like enzyme